MITWLPIDTAPKDKLIIARKHPMASSFATWWGKANHVPFWGWQVGSDPEDLTEWSPTEWLEGSEHYTDFNVVAGVDQ